VSSSNLTSSLICTRYAGALVDLAEQGKVVEKVQNDLTSLKTALDGSKELSEAISSPLVSVNEQARVMEELAKKIKMQGLTKNFLGVLAQNRRVKALPDIIKTYEKIVAQRSGLVDVHVQTAEALGEEQYKTVKERIEKALGTTIRMDENVSPEIMGGMVVTIGSYMIDDSVRRKIERLGMALKPGANQDSLVSNVKEVG